jgi:hypothetical protein
MFANAMWAIGNLVLLGKGSSMVVQDVDSSYPADMEPLMKDGGGSNKGHDNTLIGDQPSGKSTASGFVDAMITNPLNQLNLFGPDSTHSKEKEIKEIPSSAEKGGGHRLSLAKNMKILTSQKLIKNRTRFVNAHIAEKIKNIIFTYIEYPELMLWTSRVINNLGKSQKVKLYLLDNGCLDALMGICEKYSSNHDVMEWATLAKETLLSSAEPFPSEKMNS